MPVHWGEAAIVTNVGLVGRRCNAAWVATQEASGAAIVGVAQIAGLTGTRRAAAPSTAIRALDAVECWRRARATARGEYRAAALGHALYRSEALGDIAAWSGIDLALASAASPRAGGIAAATRVQRRRRRQNKRDYYDFGHGNLALAGNAAMSRVAAQQECPAPHLPSSQRGGFGILRPAIAMISRWISFVPPPNVSTSVER
jgi:hypothetical protein